MLAIRLKRTGRSGHAQFRMIVQDSRFSPSGGRVIAYIGSYDPHTKTALIDSEKAAKFLSDGAQPSDRAARLLKKEGVKLPSWVKLDEPKKREVRNPDKRRSTMPDELKAEATPEPESSPEVPAESPEEEAVSEALAEDPKTEPPAEPESPQTAEDDKKPAE